jgi:exopolyphosphatase/guanosine-5'-triphosphate,3'-diphosphate pyrophosphatase
LVLPAGPAARAAAVARGAAAGEAAAAEHPRFLDPLRMVGLAGTVTTLSSLQSGSVTYDRDAVHHSVLTAGQVDRWYQVLATDDRAARLARPGMVRGREDVIVGGALILSVLMGRLGFDRCLVSEADILDGLVASQLDGSAGAVVRPAGSAGSAGRS